jgi:hypothetical protein
MVDPTPAELMRAQGHFMVFLSSLLERRGVVAAGELATLLQVYADVVAESEPGEGAILAFWAAVARTGAPH